MIYKTDNVQEVTLDERIKAGSRSLSGTPKFRGCSHYKRPPLKLESRANRLEHERRAIANFDNIHTSLYVIVPVLVKRELIRPGMHLDKTLDCFGPVGP